MKEYKIVCTRDEHHNLNGKDVHMDVATPMYGNTRHNEIYQIKARAELALEEAIEECAKHDASHDNNHKYTIRTKQYNFRIMSREVSEWE